MNDQPIIESVNEPQRDFSAKLRELMAEQQDTQIELARLLDANQSAVHRWCHGRGRPSYVMLLKLKRLYDCTLEYLLDPTVTQRQRITEEEAEILELVGQVGYAVARRRMLLIPDTPESEPSDE